MAKSGCILYIMLLLLPLTTPHLHKRDDWGLQREELSTLNQLRNIKRRVSSQLLQQQSEPQVSVPRLHALATVKRRYQTCRKWNDSCVPWSSQAQHMCCDKRHLVCRCNLWMQNCRCVARGWGK